MFDDKPANNPAINQPGADIAPAPKGVPVNLPTSGQPPVKPKPGRPAPGTEDIFDDTDKVPDKPLGDNQMPVLGQQSAMAPSAMPKAGPPEPLAELPDDLEDGGGSRKFFWLGVVVVILILAAGGYYAYGKFFAGGDFNLPFLNLENISPDQLNSQFEDNLVNLNLNQNKIDEAGGSLDELLNGNQNNNLNQPSNLDSDKDGLSDAEEEDFGTDPFEVDSDGDGLFDYEEVNAYGTDPLDPDTDGDGYLDGEEVAGGYNPNGSGTLFDLNLGE
jgi:hypothetical protein